MLVTPYVIEDLKFYTVQKFSSYNLSNITCLLRVPVELCVVTTLQLLQRKVQQEREVNK